MVTASQASSLDHREVRQSKMFRNILHGNMGCVYRNNAKTWMKQNYFLEWVKDFDCRMEQFSMLTFLDKCSADVSVDELPSKISLQNITVLYLPTSQHHIEKSTCDQDIIHCFKDLSAQPKPSLSAAPGCQGRDGEN